MVFTSRPKIGFVLKRFNGVKAIEYLLFRARTRSKLLLKFNNNIGHSMHKKNKLIKNKSK